MDEVPLRGTVLAWVLIIAVAVITFPDASSYSGGISVDDSKSGCICHSSSPASDLMVTLSGLPATYDAGVRYNLTVALSGGPEVTSNPTNQGGFNLEASAGDLSSVDSNTQEKEDGSLTHNSEGNDQRSWKVEWVAPADDSLRVSFTLRGNAVNGDGEASEEDHWNEAEYTSKGSGYEEESPGLSTILTIALLLGIACRRRLRY
ncbi:MAG: hypothetical protein QGG57_02695 [Candidatus Poseidoniia archaeon]|nr:hypothetical protein [Candidatus Poseidoniia archaeon]